MKYYIIGFLFTIVVSCIIYYCLNHGMAHNAKGQQTRRFIIGSFLVWIPLVAVGADILQQGIVLAWFIGVLWMLTYPLLYHLTNRKSSPDYENYGEISCGIYLFGWLSAMWLLGLGPFVALIEWGLLTISMAQIVYYMLYGVCIDANGMKLVQDTDFNEIIEFARSYGLWKSVGIILLLLASIPILIMMNGGFEMKVCEQWKILLLATIVIIFFWYIFKTYRGMFIRSGIVRLWLDIKEYSATNNRYITDMKNRIAKLNVEPAGLPLKKPHTIMMVIGESASRDYMSAFTDMEHDTTPWMRQMAEDKDHTVIFPHAYSCTMHTVQVLEKALTEYNQYNDKQFYESCSIVDIAHKLGYRVHWYSNQGHLGVNDTPITLVANTAEVAKWTNQDLGKVQYDHTLVDFLDELDPEQNNFLVLHLMGSHFNFLSRYPREATVWGEPGVQHNVLNYENSLHYTDSVLESFYNYVKDRLNLQVMVYFSDHATVPDKHRSPNFRGFGATRIPLFVTMSDDYLEHHKERAEALKANSKRYWTNDLVYELMCGIFDISSNHYDETASLASLSYKYQREQLLTYEGVAWIKDDDSGVE